MCIYDMLQQPVSLYFAHTVYLWVSYDSLIEMPIISLRNINQLIVVMEKSFVFVELWGFKGLICVLLLSTQ
jgi:hypothetical protein